MALIKYKLGELIFELQRRNSNLQYGLEYVRGISNTKEIMPTKAAVDESVLHKFYVVYPGEFVYNPRTTRMGDKVGLGYNDTNIPLLFSFNNIAFAIKESAKDLLLGDYLYLYFNRSEFDRYAIINSWGSATELFTFQEMCDIDIELPSIEIQRKYVDIYNAMLANQRSYERGLDDMKLVCDAYVDQLRNSLEHMRISDLLEVSEEKNELLKYGIDDVRGVSIEKKFISTKADMEGVSLKSYYLVRPEYFAYVTVTSRNGEKISLAYNNSEDTYICSSSYIVFRVKDQAKLLPGYLNILLSRDEFNRYARFNSWGSARETFDWEEMCDVRIPIPDIDVQQYITNIFIVYQLRKEINEQLKAQIRDICPILIKGSVEEASA